jgi:excisionase family DNA binding protein
METDEAEPAEEEFLRPGEVGRMLGVSAKTVDRWADAGKIGHVVTLGGHRRFPAGEVHDLATRMQMGRRPERSEETAPAAS